MLLSMRSRSHLSGLTLVETCLVISLIAFGLAAFVPAFYQRINSSKLSEAPTQLAALRRGTAAYYEASHPTPGGLHSVILCAFRCLAF